MKKSGLADSPFFATPPQKNTEPEVTKPTNTRRVKKLQTSKRRQRHQYTKRASINRDTTIPSNRDTMQPRHRDTTIEAVRRAVKELGKEAATHRFTVAEKKAISDIIYSYKGQGVRTSENEISRIAVNFVINDYKENGQNSILDKVLKALKG